MGDVQAPSCRVCKEDRKVDVPMLISPHESKSEWADAEGNILFGTYHLEGTQLHPVAPCDGLRQIGGALQWRCPHCCHGVQAPMMRPDPKGG